MNEDDLPESFVEARKLGCVSSSDWQSYGSKRAEGSGTRQSYQQTRRSLRGDFGRRRAMDCEEGCEAHRRPAC